MSKLDPKQAFIVGMDPALFVDYFVVDATPLLFGDKHSYHDWRRECARRLDVDPASLHIVGSAALGFSMKPKANLRDFQARSDVDVAVVSAVDFDRAWRTLRDIQHRHFRYPEPQATSLREHVVRDVFRACIATDYILPLLPFATAWIQARDAMTDQMGRRVNFRLYRDLEGLRNYQQQSVRRLRREREGIL